RSRATNRCRERRRAGVRLMARRRSGAFWDNAPDARIMPAHRSGAGTKRRPIVRRRRQGGPMPDAEIAALRALLTSRPRPNGADERRQRLDDLGRTLGAPTDARLEPVAFGSAKAEWSATPEANGARAVLYLHGGGYMAGSVVSHRQVAVEIGRAA